MLKSPVPWWQGESLAGKTMLLMPELGFGDEIAYVRYAMKLGERATEEDGLVCLCCWESLETLFARSLADYCNVLFLTTRTKGMILQSEHFKRRTVLKSSLMSMPLALGETITDRFPYLTADPARVNAWRQRLSNDKTFKVGVSWTGRDDHESNALRSVPLFDVLEALKDISGVTFYSLQAGKSDDAMRAGMVDFTAEWKSFDDTAAFLSSLDLTIAIDNVIGDLACALNLTTWVFADLNAHFYLGRQGRETPWYPSARVYRQRKIANWTGAFEEVRKDLTGRQ
jgi:hypothetical protein